LLAVISLFAVPGLSGATAPDTAPIVTFAASGTFASTPISGADTLKLAGEPFNIGIPASAASVPIKSGPIWQVFSPFKMTGIVHSGLVGTSPISIASGAASILQLMSPDYDLFETAFPVNVIGIDLTINATIYAPPGTMTTPLIHTFTEPVTLTPANATMTYSDGTASTVLAIQTGTLTATIPTGAGR
jgi:hypothetical protein